MKGTVQLRAVAQINPGSKLLYKSNNDHIVANIESVVGHVVKMSFDNSPNAAIITRSIELTPKLRRIVVAHNGKDIPVSPEDILRVLPHVGEDVEFEVKMHTEGSVAVINVPGKQPVTEIMYTPKEAFQLVWKALWTNEPIEEEQARRQFAADWWQKNKKK